MSCNNHSIFLPQLRRLCSLLCLFYWLIALPVGLHKSYSVDFQETWMEDGFWPRIDPINFWMKRSGPETLISSVTISYSSEVV